MRVSILLVSLVLFLSACSTEKSTDFTLPFKNDTLLPYTSIRNQGRTQTCWAYTMASLLESDRLRMMSDTVRLSVMYAVRQKYMNQFEQYYYSKGADEIRNGGLGHSFLRVLREKGAIPYEVYKGHLPDAKRHDHRELLKNLKSLAKQAVENKDTRWRSYNSAYLTLPIGLLFTLFRYCKTVKAVIFPNTLVNSPLTSLA